MNYERIATAIRFIKENRQEQPRLETIAGHVNMSPAHFQRMFQEWAGTSPKGFLQYLNVEYAKRILKQTHASLFDTACEVGLSGTGRLYDSAFKSYGCGFIEIPTDAEGMIMNDLENTLTNTPNIKLIYVIPTFQNPTGKTWSLERRKKLAELSSKYGIAVVEDNPYGELRFEGGSLPKPSISEIRPVFVKELEIL